MRLGKEIFLVWIFFKIYSKCSTDTTRLEIFFFLRTPTPHPPGSSDASESLEMDLDVDELENTLSLELPEPAPAAPELESFMQEQNRQEHVSHVATNSTNSKFKLFVRKGRCISSPTSETKVRFSESDFVVITMEVQVFRAVHVTTGEMMAMKEIPFADSDSENNFVNLRKTGF